LREVIIIPERHGSATGGSIIGEKLIRENTTRMAALFDGFIPDAAAGYPCDDHRSELKSF
jgi:hypothetical protein